MRVYLLPSVLTVFLLISVSQEHYLSPYDSLKHNEASVNLGKAATHTHTHTFNCYTDSSVSLTVTPSLLENSGSWVTVSWIGVTNPAISDWVGVYSPPVKSSIDPINHAPIKFQVS